MSNYERGRPVTAFCSEHHFRDQRIRTFIIDGRILWAVADICAVLEVPDVAQALRWVDYENVELLGDPDRLWAVNRLGLVELVSQQGRSHWLGPELAVWLLEVDLELSEIAYQATQAGQN